MRLAPAVAVSLVIVALAGCSSGKPAKLRLAPTTTSSTAAPATTTTAPATTLPPATTTTEAGGPYATFTSPDAAAGALLTAWLHGDRSGAARAATPAAIAALFATPAPRTTPENRGCNAGLGGMASCFYRIGSNALRLQLQDVPPTQWQVVQASLVS